MLNLIPVVISAVKIKDVYNIVIHRLVDSFVEMEIIHHVIAPVMQSWTCKKFKVVASGKVVYLKSRDRVI